MLGRLVVDLAGLFTMGENSWFIKKIILTTEPVISDNCPPMIWPLSTGSDHHLDERGREEIGEAGRESSIDERLPCYPGIKEAIDHKILLTCDHLALCVSSL